MAKPEPGAVVPQRCGAPRPVEYATHVSAFWRSCGGGSAADGILQRHTQELPYSELAG